MRPHRAYSEDRRRVLQLINELSAHIGAEGVSVETNVWVMESESQDVVEML